MVRRAIDRATDTPATVPTAARPATPANQPAFDFRRDCLESLSLNGAACLWGASVRPDDPASRTGDDLVVNGAEQVGPVLRGRFTVGARPEQDRLVAVG